MKLFNTLTHQEEEFRPKDQKTVRMYVCGPTVYDHLHIGNLRPIIVFDALRKYMERFKGWGVLYVQNITDVDDKLINRSRETGEPVEALAARFTEAYFDLLRNLGAAAPSASPRATEHIPQMVELIQTLVDKGYAYERGDVYFRVAAFADYGRLSGRRREDQQAGSRVATSGEKDDPLDFVLWKKAKPGEPKWPSPWGEGRPGWHTECVVLSRQYLGEPLDIHAGGNDLIFPHHENEIAQAEAATGRPFFRFFIHNGMLNFGGEKMSKSLGNFAFAYQVLEKFDAQTIRYFYLTRHYRKPLDYSDEGLEEAKKALARIQTLIEETQAELSSAEAHEPGPAGKEFLELLPGFRARYVAEMESDLNTVGAIAAIQELVAEANRFRATAQGADRLALCEAVSLIRELGWPLGLFQEQARLEKGLEDGLMRLLIDLRAELRKKREFALADSIRDRLAALGVELKDTAQGTIWT